MCRTIVVICRDVVDVWTWWLRVLGNGDGEGTYTDAPVSAVNMPDMTNMSSHHS